MRPELDSAGREVHGRWSVLALVHAPLLVELVAPSGVSGVAVPLALGTGLVLAHWFATASRATSGPPPARRAGDRA
jgi:hypothetical protein